MTRPYSFKLCLACGIPKVNLEGTKIGQNYKKKSLNYVIWNYSRYGFLVDPVILKLIETYKGEVDEEFWATIASKVFYGSGEPGNINGW